MVREDVTARPPNVGERALFATDQLHPVLVLTRSIRTADGFPFQVAVLTTPAHVRRYRYELKIQS
jgi:hypothetical protein